MTNPPLNQEKQRIEENPVIKEFRKKYAEQIDLLLHAVPKSEWPEHQAARILYNIHAAVVRELREKIDGMGFVRPWEAGTFAMHSDGYNQAIEEVLELLSAPNKDKEE